MKKLGGGFDWDFLLGARQPLGEAAQMNWAQISEFDSNDNVKLTLVAAWPFFLASY